MELSNLWLKMARKENLTPQEMDYLKRYGDELQLASNDVRKSKDTFTTTAIYAQDAFFSRLPNGYVSLDKQSATSIADSTQTTITNYQTWSPMTGDTVSTSNEYFDIDTTNGRIYVKKANRHIGFYVFNTWNVNATGYRSARIYQYNKDGTEITYSSVYRHVPPAANNFITTNIIFMPWSSPRDVGDYATMRVYQTSGGALDLNSCAFGAFIIR